MSGVEPLSAVVSLFKGMYEQYSKMKDVDDALRKLVTHIGSIANTLEQASGKIVDTEAVSVLLGAGKELQDFLSKYQPSGGLKSTLKKSFMNFVKAGSNAGKIEEMSHTIDEALKRLNVSTSVEMCAVVYELSGEFQKMQQMQEEMHSSMKEGFAQLIDKMSQMRVKEGAESIQNLLELHPFPVKEWVEEHHGDKDDDESERSELGPPGAFGVTVRMKLRASGGQGGAVVAVKKISLKKVRKNMEMELSDIEAMVAKEIEVLKSLKHKHIVEYIGDYCDKSAKMVFIVMELAGGGSLLDHIRNNGHPQPTDRVVMLMEQLCQAIEYVHGRGILHRDLKGSNVLLSSTGAIKVIDFGLAFISRESGSMLSARDTKVGHEYYRSPEMMETKGYGKEHDCWALGCLLVELLLGRQIGGPIYPQQCELRDNLLAEAFKTDAFLGGLARKLLEREPEHRPSATEARFELMGELRKTRDQPPSPDKNLIVFDEVPMQAATTSSGKDVSFVISGDLVSRKDLSVDMHRLETIVCNLITAKDPRALDCLTSIEYIAAKAFAGGLHVLLQELADAAYVLALPPGALKIVEGVRRFVGKHLTVLGKPPTPSVVFQLALQEPDDSPVCRGAAELSEHFAAVEWHNKPQEMGACLMRLDFDEHATGVAFSPDGKLLASAIIGNVVFFTDRVTGEVKGTLRGHSGSVRCVTYSPDGKHIAT
eukprot:CAMPEP_0173418420 /NCGR_PEP_ID=MMETSP1357-20121228/578_1 /TAXON_ID=77926 /ORGANISM="Hemiselmis rufescens, Strain PCC563" /LENGTH=707 /DNA_ID=CAMNT_0014380907 /DNA_START=300 /DNA_END=2419 /DNA_ORIENTATION=+